MWFNNIWCRGGQTLTNRAKLKEQEVFFPNSYNVNGGRNGH